MNSEMTDTREDEPRECWSCSEMHFVSENGLCSTCKSEVRAIEDCWLVQEFRKRYSDDEVKEAIEQMRQSLLAVWDRKEDK